MALQKSHTLDNELTAATAYCKIDAIRTDHNKAHGNIHFIEVAVYASQAAYDGDKPPIDTIMIEREYDPADTVSFATLYAWLKTLPEFAGAVDA